ncbi:MAG: tetratricopeptide repeat protein [Candidatus Hydrogenedentes bacterium]|nr:tetratricopeptide repeat protein [Candidatus Hydrogenedentota bacterium]
MDTLLDMESSLRTASEPRMPESPAQPLMLADAGPTGIPAAPIPLRPESLTEGTVIPAQAGIQEGGTGVPPVVSAPQGASPVPSPTLPQLPPTPEGLASKLAQSEGVVPNLNLAITPATNRLKGKLEEHPQPTAAAKPSAKVDYAPVPRTAKALPSAEDFLKRLDHPEPLQAKVKVAQLGDAPPAPRVSSHHYLTHPEVSPAAPELIAANELLLAGDFLGALFKTLDVMDQYTHTPPVLDAQTQFNDIFNALIRKEEGGDSAPFQVVEAGLPQGNEALLNRFRSVESRYALIEFFQHRMLQGQKADNAESARTYADQTMDLADRTMQQDSAHPLQSDIMHYYYDTAVYMGGETYDRCVAYLQNVVRQGEPSIARWTGRLLLAEVYTLTEDNPAERTLVFGGLIDELESAGVQAALEDSGVYVWLQAAIESEVGQAWYALADFDRAAEHFNRTLQYPKGSEAKAASMYLLADIAARQNPYDPEIAIAKYQEFLTRFPKDANADAGLLNMASLYHAYGDYPQALQLYGEVLERYGDTRSAPAARQAIEYILANQQDTVEVASTRAPQSEGKGELAMHCGPQALQKLLELKGIASTVEELATLAGTDGTGTTMAALSRAADAKGLPLTGIQANDLAEVSIPFVALLDGNHFVLVSQVAGEQLRIYDSGQPESALNLATFAKRWAGQALVLGNSVPPIAKALPPAAMEELRGGGGPVSIPPDLPKSSVGIPTIGVNSPGVNAEIDPFTTSLNLNELDLSLKTRGASGLAFSRSYRAEKGSPRTETSSTAKWWENNIGLGWSHSYNLHLRTSGGATPGTVLYWDAQGIYRTYTLDSTAGGYNIYKRSATANPDELANVLKRNTTTLAFTLETGSGSRIEFSPSTTSGDFIARVESLVDAMGNTVTFTYDNASVALGKLTKVQSPAGDAQHLAFTYSGNLITKVELKKNSTVLNSVSFAYNGSSELVTVTDHAAKTVEYEYGTSGSLSGSRFITKITNKRGVETDFAWAFGLNSLSLYEAHKIEVDNVDGLTTVYDRSITTNASTNTNWDGATLLAKQVKTPVTGDTSLSRYSDYYIDSTTYERWTNTYDADRNLTEVTAPGSVDYAEYTYNAVGQALTASNGTGPVTEYEYDPSGLWVESTIDGAGIETVNEYDANHNLEKTTHPSLDAAGIQHEYDAYGQVTKDISPTGVETVYTYDTLGRLEETVQDPSGLAITTSYVYDDLGNMIEMTDPRGEVTEYEYGGPGCGGCGGGSKLIKKTDALSHETEWIYNADGLLETTIDAAGIETDYTYDSMNRLTTITRPAGSTITSTIAYNALGQVASRTDFGGNITSYDYDHMGRAVKVTDAVGDIDYAYDSLGQLVTVSDSLGHETTNTYDSAFRLTKVTDEIGKEIHYFYDAAGRKESVGAGTSGTVDPTTYAYSSTTGQVESVEYGTSTYTANYEYDGEGRLVKLTDWLDAVDGLRYGYDAVGRLETITDYDDSVLTYTYDNAGNVLSIVDYHGNTTAYTYNDIGQLATLTAPGSKVWTYTYDTGNRLAQVDIPNGMHTEYTYDTSGRQNSIHHKDGTTVKQGFDYTFDDGGNITRIDQEDGSYWEYDYDGRDRLTDAIRGNHATPTILATYEYTYDDADNMLTKKVPWYDDFEDGNHTGWSGNTANYTVSGGVLKNTLDTTVRDLYLSETDADHDLSFDYVRYSSTGRVDVYLRTIDGNNRLYLELNPGNIKLQQVDGGTSSTLATYTTTVAQNTWYKLRANLDGTSVKIYWGAEGEDFNEIISTTTTKTTTVRAAYFRAQANSEHGFDNIQLIAGTRSTTEAFTYNNANEQITHAKNGVTTTMTYDDWGRLATRDDGTHDATYAYRYGGKLYSVTSDFPGEGNVTYETGGDGNRRSRDDGTSFTWYNWKKDQAIQEEGQGTGLGDGPLLKTHMKGQADILGSSPASGTYNYLATDHLGSTRSAYNASRIELGTADFVPFGASHDNTLPVSVDSVYGGHEYDARVNLYHAQYRDYSIDSSRWLARDPQGMVDGPNVYVYAGENPVTRVDISGGEWSSYDFVWWYYFGWGQSINLKDVGLLDNYRAHHLVKKFVNAQKRDLTTRATQFADRLAFKCFVTEGLRWASGSVGNSGSQGIDVARGPGSVDNPYTNPLWSIGWHRLYQNGRCSVVLDCRTRKYTYQCSSNFSFNDSFRDPTGYGFEMGIGIPYDIHANWNEQWSGSGTASPIITAN